MIWIVGLSCFALFIVLILFIRIVVTINYFFNGEENLLNITVAIFRLKIFRKRINLSEEFSDSKLHKPEFKTFPVMLRDIFQQLKNLNTGLNQMLKILRIDQLNWQTAGGTGEAASTGITSGGVWTIKGIIAGFLMEKVMMKCQPEFTVQPHFQIRFFQTKLDCIVSVRLGQAIHALFRLMWKNNIKEKAYI